jgi:hypothetical protein
MTKEQILKFLVAGRAVFTLVSRKTGEHYTYRIQGKDSGMFFASVKRSSDEWLYLGVYRADECQVVPTRNSKASHDSPSFAGLNWFLRHIDSPKVRFQHEGRCGRCGRPLTHPESIDSGMGPECSGRGRERTRGHSNAPAQHLPPLPKGPRAVTPASVQNPLPGFEADRLKAITCPKCNGKRDVTRRCSDCGFGNDCCRALDRALDPKPEPNLVVPLLLSLQPGGMK